MKIVAVSDIHCKWQKVKIPECDLLISCGDYSFKGEPWVVKDYHKWLNKQPAKHIISVNGNHELWVEKNFNEAKMIATEACPAVHFVEEGLVEIEGIKIWCSSYTPEFFDWAYNVPRGAEMKKHWDRIPDDVNILAIHGPPYKTLDELVYVDGTPKGEFVGCADLPNRIKELKDLDLVFFGHIHANGNQEIHLNGVSYYNVSICDEMYYPSNPPRIVEYER